MDILTYGLLNKKVEEAKNVSGEKITEAVNTYLDENPPTTGATAEQAAQINKNVADIDGLKGDLNQLDTTIVDRDLKVNLSKTVTKNVTYNEWKNIDLNCTVPTSDDRYYVYGQIETTNKHDGYMLGFRFRRINTDGSQSEVYYNVSGNVNEHSIIGAFDLKNASGIMIYADFKYTGEDVPFSETFKIKLKLYKGAMYLCENIKIKDSETINVYNSAITLGTLNAKKPNFDKASKTLTFYKNTYLHNPVTGLRHKFDSDLVVTWDDEWVVSMNNVWLNPDTKDVKMSIYTKKCPDSYTVLIGSINAKGDGWLIGGYTVDDGKKDYYVLPSTFASKIQDIQTNQKDKFVFAIQTDTHFYNENNDAGKNIAKLSQYVGFDFIANLGDIIQGYATATEDTNELSRSYMTEIIQRYIEYSRCPVLLALGNHDSNRLYVDAYGGDEFSKSELYGRIVKQTKNTVSIINPKGELYYYVDFDDVRVIMLNTQDSVSAYTFVVGQNQINWLESALQTDKNVMIMCHTPLIRSLTQNYPTYASDVIEKLKTFRAKGGKLIGCFYGHTHTQTSETEDGILHVTFKNGGSNAEVVMVDTLAKTIETIGIGNSMNRSFTYI